MTNKKSTSYAYYPGCSLQSAAHAYATSIERITEVTGLELHTVEDWNCCGATEYFTLNALPTYSLVARNLSLAAENGNSDLIAPCSLCYLNLYKTDKIMGDNEDLSEKVNQALKAGGLSYTPGTLRVRHLLDVIIEDIGLEAVKEHVSTPLQGLRVAPYYGCLIARPYSKYNQEYPTHMDDLLQVLGSSVIDFPLKTHCCGGHMTQISEDTAYELIRRILQNASEYKADVIVTLCPMCQLNLDAYQTRVNQTFGTNFNIPVLFFTQLMGLAFGMKAREVGIGSEIIDASEALKKIGTQEESSKSEKRKKRDKKALPMPPAG